MGTSGAGFAGATLILARQLPESEYALFTLFLALVNLGYALAPAGIETFVVRRPVEFGPRFLQKVSTVTVPVGVIFGAVGRFGHDLSVPVTLLLALAIAAGGAMAVAVARFQGELRFGLSLSIAQSPNLFLILAALVVVLAGGRDASVAVSPRFSTPSGSPRSRRSRPRELALVNYLGWASVMLAIAAGLAGAWRLAGVIYGVALGWPLRAIAAFYVTARHLRLPAVVPAATP